MGSPLRMRFRGVSKFHNMGRVGVLSRGKKNKTPPSMWFCGCLRLFSEYRVGLWVVLPRPSLFRSGAPVVGGWWFGLCWWLCRSVGLLAWPVGVLFLWVGMFVPVPLFPRSCGLAISTILGARSAGRGCSGTICPYCILYIPLGPRAILWLCLPALAGWLAPCCVPVHIVLRLLARSLPLCRLPFLFTGVYGGPVALLHQ